MQWGLGWRTGGGFGMPQSPLSGDSPREGRHRRGEQTGRTVFPKAGPQGGIPLGVCLKHWLSGRPQPC